MESRGKARRGGDIPDGRDPLGRADHGAICRAETSAEQERGLRRRRALHGLSRRSTDRRHYCVDRRTGGWCTRNAGYSNEIGFEVASPGAASLSASDCRRDWTLPIADRGVERTTADGGV